ncbi:hypothetical protein AKJ08_1899 [Vulgatibacter incomptus]|uniref:Uncharacterized protein n=1 Tax=Vulgatibacter incomptus TaxID=1391653 RepID=A0A0K1PDD3_9BACT|nr:hypothetical protein AKJ08_1899 [Vulgatibacter incomptus]
MELEVFENPRWNLRKARGPSGHLYFRTCLAAAPKVGARREDFEREVEWLLSRLRDPPERRAWIVSGYEWRLPARRLRLVMDASDPKRLVFTYQGIDAPAQHRAWDRIRRQLLAFAFHGRAAAFIVGRERGFSRSLDGGSPAEPIRIESEAPSWLGFRKKRVVADEAVTFVRRCPRALLDEAARTDGFVVRGDLVVASLALGDREAARELVEGVVLFDRCRGLPPHVRHECMACEPGGHYLLWHAPSRAVEEIRRFAEGLVEPLGWSFAVEAAP